MTDSGINRYDHDDKRRDTEISPRNRNSPDQGWWNTSFQKYLDCGNWRKNVLGYWIIVPILVWIISIIWAYFAIDSYNQQLLQESDDLLIKTQNDENTEMIKWFKDNPGKSINDYYKKDKT